MLLRTTGAEVHVAHDGPTALAEFELREPDVVLLDIGMPDMDGYEVARRLREISSPQPRRARRADRLGAGRRSTSACATPASIITWSSRWISRRCRRC